MDDAGKRGKAPVPFRVFPRPVPVAFSNDGMEQLPVAAISGVFCHLLLGIVGVWTSLVAQTVKRLPTMRETWVQSLGREDLLEKEMATHSSILPWKIPWMGYSSWGRKESDNTERHSLIVCVDFLDRL